MGGEGGESYEQMSLRDLKLDTKDDEGGASETQMSGERKRQSGKEKKAIRERPKQQYKSREREKCARAGTQTQFQKDAREKTANYRVVKYGSAVGKKQKKKHTGN